MLQSAFRSLKIRDWNQLNCLFGDKNSLYARVCFGYLTDNMFTFAKSLSLQKQKIKVSAKDQNGIPLASSAAQYP